MISLRRSLTPVKLAVLVLLAITIALCTDIRFEVQASEECVSNEQGECINPEAEADESDTIQEEIPEEPATAPEQPIGEGAEEPAVPATDVTADDEPVDATPEHNEPVPYQEGEVTEEEESKPVKEEEEPTPAEEEPAKETPTPPTPLVEEEENTPNCPSRPHVIKCAGEYLDTNKNAKLERSELEAAIDKLPWWSKGILTILGSVDKMMDKCDVDKDGAIGMVYDMEASKETCLATCFKRRAFKAAFFPDCAP